jgi:hypothetical protein
MQTKNYACEENIAMVTPVSSITAETSIQELESIITTVYNSYIP